jgi:hypothetical protein
MTKDVKTGMWWLLHQCKNIAKAVDMYIDELRRIQEHVPSQAPAHLLNCCLALIYSQLQSSQLNNLVLLVQQLWCCLCSNFGAALYMLALHNCRQHVYGGNNDMHACQQQSSGQTLALSAHPSPLLNHVNLKQIQMQTLYVSDVQPSALLDAYAVLHTTLQGMS